MHDIKIEIKNIQGNIINEYYVNLRMIGYNKIQNIIKLRNRK